ncbi:MAG: glycosyltransferase family 4 protein [bacterium]|nr:glycosyltransferase family 4 protein [bacterium]
MKVLMLTPYLPYPLFSGGQVRLFNLIKNLSAKHEITLFSFIRNNRECEYLPQLLKYCRKVEVFKKRKPWSFSTLFKTALSSHPLLMTMYNFPQFGEKINQELSASQYDLIHVECFYVMQNLPPLALPVVLTDQNIEYLVYERFVKNFKWFFLKPLMYLDIFKLKFWENKFWQTAQKLVAMSEEEKRLMNIPGAEIVPNGVDIKFFKQKIIEKDKKLTVVFVGNFRWIQNKDALRFLYSEIWPKVVKEMPSAKLLVVGKDLPKGLRSMLGDEVTFEDGMEDIREAYQRAHVLLAPVRASGGTSYKVLEAMASCLPVVTTSLGIEGIEARDGQEVIIRDNPQDLAQAVIDLLKDENRRKEMGQKAQKLIEEKYDWGKISAKLSRIWEEVGKEK